MRKKLGGRERVVFFDSCKEVKVASYGERDRRRIKAGEAIDSLNTF